MATPRAKAATARPVATPDEMLSDVVGKQQEVRQPARQAMATIPGRAVALNRAGQPIQRAAADAGVDQFYIPPHLPPEGWSWEWKEDTVLGEHRSGIAAQQAQVGWEPVMYESYPGQFAPEYDEHGEQTKGPVRRGGLMLKERAAVLTLEARMDEKRKADERVGNAKHQYNRLDTRGASTAEFDHASQRASYVRTSQETVAAPGMNPNGGPTRQPID